MSERESRSILSISINFAEQRMRVGLGFPKSGEQQENPSLILALFIFGLSQVAAAALFFFFYGFW